MTRDFTADRRRASTNFPLSAISFRQSATARTRRPILPVSVFFVRLPDIRAYSLVGEVSPPYNSSSMLLKKTDLR
jgi:hypothetical protein